MGAQEIKARIIVWLHREAAWIMVQTLEYVVWSLGVKRLFFMMAVLMTCFYIVFRFLGFIDWTWVWVLSPLWIFLLGSIPDLLILLMCLWYKLSKEDQF